MPIGKRPLPFASDSVNEKVYKIKANHHKEYRKYYRNSVIATYIFIFIICLGVWFLAVGELWGSALIFVGLYLFGWMPSWIFRLGNEDDRVYFLECIAAASDEYELLEMGFDKYEDIEIMIHNKLINEDIEIVAMDNNIINLHNKFDLRNLADEVEFYERMRN